MLQKEGQVRIPAGCAISGIFARDGRRMSGEAIIRSIALMHDRSNGLGGGFAGYTLHRRPGGGAGNCLDALPDRKKAAGERGRGQYDA